MCVCVCVTRLGTNYFERSTRVQLVSECLKQIDMTSLELLFMVASTENEINAV